MDLVEVTNNKVFCDSSMVAKKFGQKHDKVIIIIENLISDLMAISSRHKVEKVTKHYRGRDYTAYLMDRRFFSLLAMRFKGKRALEWQIKFNDAFYEMEKNILMSNLNKNDIKFLDVREQGKVSRKEETDVIKDFIEYATAQGSKGAKWYYKNITNATYRALDLMAQKKPKLRDSMDIYQVSELLLAERVAKDQLRKYMNMGRHYKDIYDSVRDDLIVFGNSLKLN